MNGFEAQLQERLAAIQQAGLYRRLRRVDSPQGPVIQLGGYEVLNFSSNDYLGLANAPDIREAARKASEHFGAGAGASRLISGSLAPHAELEETLAAFKGSAASLVFSSGYAAAQGAIGALMGKDDVIVLDKLVHACIVDAARLSGAKLRVFAHNDLDDLEHILKWAAAKRTGAAKNVLVITESVFSMDGDQAPLRELVNLKERYGAWLMVDEAHATGLYGTNGCGLAGQHGVAERIEIQMGTLGKALGAAGGYICGSRALIDLLVNRARSFIFSTAPVPAAAAAATAAIKFVQSPAGAVRRQALWERISRVSDAIGGLAPNPSAIFPLGVGAEERATALSEELLRRGLFIPAIRFPAVARGAARLRLTVTAAHALDDITRLVTELTASGPVAHAAQPGGLANALPLTATG